MLINDRKGLQGFFAQLASASRLSTANITTIHQALLIHPTLPLIIGPITTLTFHPRRRPAIHHNKVEFLFEKSPYSLAFRPPDASGSSLARRSLRNEPGDQLRRGSWLWSRAESLTKNIIYGF